MKYPIGIQTFEQIIEGKYLYFDKTALVYDLVHNGKIYFLSRPRRFGKSLLLSTLEAYFLGKKELFKGLAIDGLETEWAEYPVFRVDFNSNRFEEPGVLESTLNTFVANAEDEYGRDENAESLGDRFRAVIANAHRETGKRVVVLVDEYDKPLLDVMGVPGYTTSPAGEKITLEERNRSVLKSFYSTFKSADADLQFVFLTGVTKFSQITVFSGFNQPDDISLDCRYETICGITEEELFEKLDAQIGEMAEKYKVTVDEMKLKLKKQYDGYHFSSRMTDIYNPFSILNAFSKMQLDNYWFRSGSPTYLIRLLEDNNVNINEMTSEYLTTDLFIDYRANKEMPLPMFYQSGYLTIKDYDMEMEGYLLDIPNDEVRRGFITLVASDYLKPQGFTAAWVLQVANALKHGDDEKLEKLFTSFFASIPYSLRDNGDERAKERHFQYTFYLVTRMISGYTVYAEKQQSEGRLDCPIETPAHVYIFEFKRDGSAESALQQIKDKGYAREYANDSRTVHLVGVNFSSKTGTIEGWKEETECPRVSRKD